MKRFLIATLVVFSAATAAQAQTNIGGQYQVIGKNANGSAYSGTATIAVTSANTCRITWVTGGTTSAGICMRNGIAFSAGYRLGNAIGLVIYEIKSDGSMDGLWTIADQPGVGAERLIPVR